MAKEKKLRYIVELDLIMEPFQFHILEKRFEIARKISNSCKGKMLDNFKRMKRNSEYQYWLKQPKLYKKTEEHLQSQNKKLISSIGL